MRMRALRPAPTVQSSGLASLRELRLTLWFVFYFPDGGVPCCGRGGAQFGERDFQLLQEAVHRSHGLEGTAVGANCGCLGLSPAHSQGS